jgi:IclR family transcriptional regulator, KDG regulon repressor
MTSPKGVAMRATDHEQPSGREPAARRVKAVDHAIDVLNVIAEANRSLGVSEIARRAGLSKATTHHMLVTLETRRFVMRDPDSACYRLSWALYELGANVVRNVNLSRVARPYLDRLAAQTGESTLLGILDGGAVLYLDRGEAPGGLRMSADAGRRGPLHGTASGKVLLAFSSDATFAEAVLSEPLAKFTGTSVTNPAALRRQLAQVRTRGYATCWQEREVGLCSLAVPLRDYTGAVVGSLALAGPASRLNTRTYQAHLPPLRATAHRIELHLGGARPQTANA